MAPLGDGVKSCWKKVRHWLSVTDWQEPKVFLWKCYKLYPKLLRSILGRQFCTAILACYVVTLQCWCERPVDIPPWVGWGGIMNWLLVAVNCWKPVYLVFHSSVCPKEAEALAVILGVVGGVLGVGLALLLIWKLLATIQVWTSDSCVSITTQTAPFECAHRLHMKERIYSKMRKLDRGHC